MKLVIVAALVMAARGQSQTTVTSPFTMEGQVKLENGAVESSGVVLVNHRGEWGLICDDGWTLEAAHVVCRMLGYVRALAETNRAYFRNPTNHDIFMDNVRCSGKESALLECDFNRWMDHDCSLDETAGVFCSPERIPPTTTTTTTSAPLTGPDTKNPLPEAPNAQALLAEIGSNLTSPQQQPQVHRPPLTYELRLTGGRNHDEGRIEVMWKDEWSVICSDTWGLLEANTVCRQLDKGHARSAVQMNYFGGGGQSKVLGGIQCRGDESHLHECHHQQVGDVICTQVSYVAGVICALTLPDLVPDAKLLQSSVYLQDRRMSDLTCALEENCASSSAYVLMETNENWKSKYRRLMRFSSSTWNYGTADFRPFIRKEDWEWHSCHRHFHSMEVFAHYDLLDMHHNRVAEGHKASFCLEDVKCLSGKPKKYVCQGYGAQGISVGCADDYLHDIDCQWIDVTDVEPGSYILKMHVNPEKKVAELDYFNNAVTCDVRLTIYNVVVTNCRITAS